MSSLQKRAVLLRKRGYSYSEISLKLGVSQSSCSLWLRNIVLSKKAQSRIAQLRKGARLKSAQSVQNRIANREKEIQDEVRKIFSNLVIETEIAKLFCAVLYWAEGEKNRNSLVFTNSDPRMIKLFLSLLRTHFQIRSNKLRAFLHLHGYHDLVSQKSYWSTITGIPSERIRIYQKPNSGRNIRQGYRGCISIRYHDVVLAKKIEFLYNALIEKYGGVG